MKSRISKPFTLDSTVRLIIVIAVSVGSVLLINYLSPVLIPFCLAWLLAYILYPLVYFVQKKMKLGNKSVSILIVMSIIAALIITIFYVLTPHFISEAIKLKEFVVNYALAENESSIIPQKWEIMLKNFIRENNIADFMNNDNMMDMMKSVFPHLWSFISNSFSITGSLFGMFITVIYLFFILRDYKKITQYFSALIPPKYRTFAQTLYRDMEEGMKQYYRGQALVALCVAVLYSAGFFIIDLPMALAMGMLIGVLNLVPYLQVVGIPPCVLLALVHAAESGNSPWVHLLGLIAVFVVVQIIQDGYLVPKIMGKRMGLNAAIILLSLSIFGMVFGVLGLIIALPTTSLALSYYKRYILARYSDPVNDTQEYMEEENQ